MKKKTAFTLIELLVVIAIIALLLAILMPSLKKAKKIAQIVVCVANCKTLSTAWSVYAADNDSKMVSAMTGYSDFDKHLLKIPLRCPNPWVDWAGYPQSDGSDKEKQILTVEQGVLYPYVKTIKAYRCPASRKDQVKCYSIPDNLGNLRFIGNPALGDQKIMTKTTQIKVASEQIVFLDEDEITYGGYTIWYNKPEWWDLPPARHNNGITLGYADGHSAYYKWRDQDTIDLAQKVISNLKQPGNEDLIMIQRGVYGKLGYTP